MERIQDTHPVLEIMLQLIGVRCLDVMRQREVGEFKYMIVLQQMLEH